MLKIELIYIFLLKIRKMPVYKLTELENGDILLKESLIDYENYTKILKENGDILLIKKNVVKDLESLKKYNYKNSKIESLNIDNEEYTKDLSYSKIINRIYKLIDNGKKIMEHTTININPGKKTDKGFCYIEDENIQISFQRVDSNKSIIEIFTQCFKNKIPLEINIKLENDKTITIYSS